MRTLRVLLTLLATAAAAGCSGYSHWQSAAATGKTHVVRRGETLSIIAGRYGRDYHDLARWNNLGDGSLIYPGQVIRLHPPAAVATGTASTGKTRPASAKPSSAPARGADPSPAWDWPVYGQIVSGFDGKPGAGTGLLIAGKAGQPVRAAASGRVVYSGGGLIGYGQLIIVKHNDTYLSAYGHNASLLVREGEAIKKGQRIATMGEGPGHEPRLHFEMMRNGKPGDPLQFLPAK